MTSSRIDLSELPPPEIVEELDYEAILATQRVTALAVAPEFQEVLDLESEPANKLLQASSLRELTLRQEFNERARQLLLAFARAAMLDHLGVTYHSTQRLVVDPGDPTATPPLPPTYEDDNAYLERILMAEDRYSTAGAEPAYVFHARTASGQVKDASCISPAAGEILITVLGQSGNGVPQSELVSLVHAYVSDARLRPMTDKVSTQAANVIDYTLQARLHLYPGADAGTILDAARQRAKRFVERMHRLGRELVRDALLAQLYVEGVERVDLLSPVDDIPCDLTQASYCTAIDLEVASDV